MSLSSLNPFKKEVVLMSPLKGTLLKGGEPLANVQIEVKILLPNGEKHLSEYYSDENGGFELPIVKDKMTLGPMTEFAVSQFVSVILNERRVKVWSAGKRREGLYGELKEPGEIVGLICDIDDEELNADAEKHGIITTCIWKEIRKV